MPCDFDPSGRTPVDVVAAIFDLEPTPAATVSAQEIARFLSGARQWLKDNEVKMQEWGFDGPSIAGAHAAMDAIEALTAENARLTSERDKLLRDRVNGYVVEDGVVNYLVIREALSKLSGVPAMSDVTMRHVEIIGEKMAALKTEVARLKGRMEAACGLIERGAVRAWNDCHYRTEPLSEDRKRVIETHDMFCQALKLLAPSNAAATEADMQELADFGQRYQPETYATDDRPLSEIVADLRAVVAASPEAQAGIAAYFAEQAEERWHDGTIYNAHRSQVEAAHAAAKADALWNGPMTDVVEAIRPALTDQPGESPLADPEYPELVRLARESSKDGD